MAIICYALARHSSGAIKNTHESSVREHLNGCSWSNNLPDTSVWSKPNSLRVLWYSHGDLYGLRLRGSVSAAYQYASVGTRRVCLHRRCKLLPNAGQHHYVVQQVRDHTQMNKITNKINKAILWMALFIRLRGLDLNQWPPVMRAYFYEIKLWYTLFIGDKRRSLQIIQDVVMTIMSHFDGDKLQINIR